MKPPSTVPDIGDWMTAAPLRDRAVTFIHISGEGFVAQAHSLPDKRVLCSQVGGTLLVAWNGRWKTDVRRVATDSLPPLVEILQ